MFFKDIITYFFLSMVVIMFIIVLAPISVAEKNIFVKDERQALLNNFGFNSTVEIIFNSTAVKTAFADSGLYDKRYYASGVYIPYENKIYLDDSYSVSAPPRLKIYSAAPHEICHSFNYENDCVDSESICELYSYYRHPILYSLGQTTTTNQIYNKYTSQLIGKNSDCLDKFFKNYKKSCTENTITEDLHRICGVKI